VTEPRANQRLVDRFWRWCGIERPPVVAVLRLEGAIGRMGPWRGGLTLPALAGAIERAFSLPRLKAVALQVNSPGGSPVQSGLIQRRIRALADEKKIPVVAFVEDVAASGGYWIALGADEILADENSIVGSIGVLSAGFGFQDLLARAGVERRVHTAGTRKAMLDPFRPEQPEDVAHLHALQQEMHESFKALVRTHRAGKLAAPESELFEGAFWTGRKALSLGLIDGIGDLRETMRSRYGEKVRLRVVGGAPSWRRRLGLAAAGEGLIGAVEERMMWARYGL
jgi:serine protease SohB